MLPYSTATSSSENQSFTLEGGSKEELKKMNIQQLRDKLKERNIRGLRNATKNIMIEAICDFDHNPKRNASKPKYLFPVIRPFKRQSNVVKNICVSDDELKSANAIPVGRNFAINKKLKPDCWPRTQTQMSLNQQSDRIPCYPQTGINTQESIDTSTCEPDFRKSSCRSTSAPLEPDEATINARRNALEIEEREHNMLIKYQESLSVCNREIAAIRRRTLKFSNDQEAILRDLQEDLATQIAIKRRILNKIL